MKERFVSGENVFTPSGSIAVVRWEIKYGGGRLYKVILPGGRERLFKPSELRRCIIEDAKKGGEI